MGIDLLINGDRHFKVPAVSNRRLAALAFASKQQKSNRDCPNRCFKRRENPKHLVTNMKAFNQPNNQLFGAVVWWASTM